MRALESRRYAVGLAVIVLLVGGILLRADLNKGSARTAGLVPLNMVTSGPDDAGPSLGAGKGK
ncbi:MAG: hypothetical protein Q8O76_02130, partial [Chloroflexota bacterium]|nr:hypothetical protein [Chloroflexota bacterium]